jgi:hypothetical protein
MLTRVVAIPFRYCRRRLLTRMVGKASVRTRASRPTRGRRVNPTNDPNGTSGSLMVRDSVMELMLGSSGRCILQRFVCRGSRVVRGWLEGPVRTEPLPTTRHFVPGYDRTVPPDILTTEL